MHDNISTFEEYLSKICSSLSTTKGADGTYLNPVTQAEFDKFVRDLHVKSVLDCKLTDDEKAEFIKLIAVHRVVCYFDGDKLVVPSGQGRSVPLAVYSALDGFKYYKGLYSSKV